MNKVKLEMEKSIRLFKNIIKDTKLNNIVFDIDTSKLASNRTGGKALCCFTADNTKDLKKMVKTCIKNKIKFAVIGNCTNILFSDRYMDIVLIKLGRDFNYVRFEGENKIVAGAAYNLLKFIIKAATRGYDFSELSGIPGTLGGSIAGNSGSSTAGICSFIKRISYISRNGNNIVERTKDLNNSDFDYRILNIPDLVAVTEAVLSAKKSDREDILKKIKNRIKNKKQTQPIGAKSSGCFFKNIKDCSKSTGELIEECGLKGFIYGGARVSGKHANFMENFKNASSEDIFVLSKIVKDVVMNNFGRKLEYEVKLVGF